MNFLNVKCNDIDNIDNYNDCVIENKNLSNEIAIQKKQNKKKITKKQTECQINNINVININKKCGRMVVNRGDFCKVHHYISQFEDKTLLASCLSCRKIFCKITNLNVCEQCKNKSQKNHIKKIQKKGKGFGKCMHPNCKSYTKKYESYCGLHPNKIKHDKLISEGKILCQNHFITCLEILNNKEQTQCDNCLQNKIIQQFIQVKNNATDNDKIDIYCNYCKHNHPKYYFMNAKNSSTTTGCLLKRLQDQKNRKSYITKTKN